MNLRKELIIEAFLTKEQIHSFVFSKRQQHNLMKGKSSSVEEIVFCCEEMIKFTQSDKFLSKLEYILDDFRKIEVKEILGIYKNETFKKFINQTENIYLPILTQLTQFLNEIAKKIPPID